MNKSPSVYLPSEHLLTLPISTISTLVKEHAAVGGVVNHRGYIISFTQKELQGIYDYYYAHEDCEDLVTIRIKLSEKSLKMVYEYDAFIWDYSSGCLAFLFHHIN